MIKPKSVCVMGSALSVALLFCVGSVVEYELLGRWFERLVSILGFYTLLLIPAVIVCGWLPARDLYRWFFGRCYYPLRVGSRS
jgi:hypothetical protein